MLAFSLFIMGNILVFHKPPDYKALTSIATGEVETYDLLPVKTYVAMYNERDGFYLTEHPNIEVQKKYMVFMTTR